MKLRPIVRSNHQIKKISNPQISPHKKITNQRKIDFSWFYLPTAAILTIVTIWLCLFLAGAFTLGGVPASVFTKFIQDPVAITAFVNRDRPRLHDRLQELEIEKMMKNYYRPQISDEIALDWYIHQIFYDWTGYVGNNYYVNAQDKLVLGEEGAKRLQQELEPTPKIQWNGFPLN